MQSVPFVADTLREWQRCDGPTNQELTISELILGDRIHRMKDSLNVHLNEVYVGAVIRRSDGRVAFEFDEGYINRPDRPTLSQSFTGVAGGVRNRERASPAGQIPSFFSNLLPEWSTPQLPCEKGWPYAKHRNLNCLNILGQTCLERSLSAAKPIEANTDMNPLRLYPETTIFGSHLLACSSNSQPYLNKTADLTIPAYGLGGDWIVKLPSDRVRKSA